MYCNRFIVLEKNFSLFVGKINPFSEEDALLLKRNSAGPRLYTLLAMAGGLVPSLGGATLALYKQMYRQGRI